MYGGAKGLNKKRTVKIYKLGLYRLLETQLVALGIKKELMDQLEEDLSPWAKPTPGVDLDLIRRELKLGFKRKEQLMLSKKPKTPHTEKDDSNRS